MSCRARDSTHKREILTLASFDIDSFARRSLNSYSAAAVGGNAQIISFRDLISRFFFLPSSSGDLASCWTASKLGGNSWPKEN